MLTLPVTVTVGALERVTTVAVFRPEPPVVPSKIRVPPAAAPSPLLAETLMVPPVALAKLAAPVVIFRVKPLLMFSAPNDAVVPLVTSMVELATETLTALAVKLALLLPDEKEKLLNVCRALAPPVPPV